MTTETKVQHTPGPWAIFDAGRDDNLFVEGIGSVCKIARKGPDGRNRELEMANARLIAAAPEMLEALEAIRTLSAYMISPGGGAGTLMKIEQLADAAIRKAKGESL